MATAMKVISPMVQGFGQDRASRFEAKQLEAQGKAVEAQGTRQAENIRRQSQGILGDMTAASVAQGGSSSDPGAIRRAAKVESRMKFNEEAALFNAGEQAAGLRMKGKAARFKGRMARNRGIMEGVGNFLSSGKDAASAGSNMLKVFGG
ncbi:MAG: hypothetical protein Unbinned8596contig1000_51 [Prokaryotic dsDNA virus sp.]|nr:MAG: hypothetical protein Unbinned8596contig1000_51 [Prokaryotic dsDNA virus sp.]